MLLLPLLLCAMPAMTGIDESHASLAPTSAPQWAVDAVWYQIFPERFRNGDPSNDPTVDDIAGAWPHVKPTQWHISSWTGDWYALQPWEKDAKGFYYHAQQRRYGGDLQGIIDKLDYLQDLGVNALYLNPVFESPSLHKYDASMYHHIDNNFGPDPAGDRGMFAKEDPAAPATWQWTAADRLFLKLIQELHARGMKIIIDGVFNHVGTTFWAFRDVVENGPRSPYKDWFTIISWGDSTGKGFDYKCWVGVKDLPELRKDSTGMAAGPRDYIHAIVQRWMDPNGDGDPSDGVDGWRLDVADMVPMAFWREFRGWVKGINPNAYITGEVWWEDWKADKMFDAGPWLLGDTFDAVMNYRWARNVCRFFKDKDLRLTATEFRDHLERLWKDYRPDVDAVLMNLLDSHDTDRLGSMIVNPDTKYDHFVNVVDNPGYNVRKPNAHELAIQKLMVAFQMMYAGAPMVYYGDEAGMWGGDDPDERKPMLWSDMHYAHESSHPFDKPRPNDPNVFNKDLFSTYRSLIHLRTEHPAMRRGALEFVLADDRKNMLGFMRTDVTEKIAALFNNSEKEQSATLPLAGFAPARTLKVLFGQGTADVRGAEVHCVLPPRSALIILGVQ